MNKIEEIKKQAIERIKGLKGVYADSHLQTRIEQVESLGAQPVHVVADKGMLNYDELGKWDNSTIWTISSDQNQEGWETDSGCSGYGLYPEVAEYYAMCINEYPKLLAKLEMAEKALEKVVKNGNLDVNGEDAENLLIMCGDIAQEALAAIRS